jgi:C4-dicarboxylate-specific signal transduction histidine kinase
LNDNAPSQRGTEGILERLLQIARLSALEEMASGIAHELNQPLGAIATFSQAGERMLNRPEPMVKAALGVFQQISNEALGAGEGIRRIRRLFNHETSPRTPCQMQELLAELQPILEVLAHKAQGKLEVVTAPTLPSLPMDQARIQHVLFVLVQNAFDAAVQNGAVPLVKITLEADKYMLHTSVSDNGLGISAELRNQVFRPFFTTKPSGTGLGLASSRSIVEAHGGTIGFDNVPAGGSRFWFRLPISND